MRRELCAVALAGLLVLAGCSSAVEPGGSRTGTPGATTGGDGTTASTASGTGSGTLTFYVSDEVNAIDDFEHLNVTIEKVSFRRSGGEEPEDDASASGSTPTSEAEGGDTTPMSEAEGDDTTPTPKPTETAGTETGTATPEPVQAAGSESGTPTPEAESGTPTPEAATGTGTPTPKPTEASGSAESDATDDDGESEEGWIVRDVDDVAVDLTELRGENARMLSQFDLPEGTYTQVRIHITGVDGTLTSGEEVNVKLPSQKLKLKKRFTVGDGEEVDFVYDATVFEAGKSGKYILKPVASESGTDVPIKEVVDGEDDGEDGGADALGARFVGDVNPGEATTVKVTYDGQPAKDATVTVGEQTYRTGEDGTVMFDVPDGTEDLEVTVTYEDEEIELKRSFGGEPDGQGEAGPDDAGQGEGKQSDGKKGGGRQGTGQNDTDATGDVVAVPAS